MNVLKKYWVSALVTIVIIVLCFINLADIPVKAPMTNFDKLVHILMLGGLSGTIFFDNSFYFRKRVSNRVIFWGSFVFPIVFGGLIEIGQQYLTNHVRNGDWWDFWFDVIGVIIAYLICLAINQRLAVART